MDGNQPKGPKAPLQALKLVEGVEPMHTAASLPLRTPRSSSTRTSMAGRMPSIRRSCFIVDEDDRRLDLLHQNVRKYETISNTVAAAMKLEGVIKRKA
jgi:hypothetical protein